MAAESSTRTTRLSGDLDDRYIEYRDGNDMTDAEALRHLIRTGLEEEEKDAVDKFEERHDRQYPGRPDTLLAGLLYDAKEMRNTALLIAGVFLVGYTLLAGPLSYLFLAVAGGYAVTSVLGFFVTPLLDRFGVGAGDETAADTPEVEA
jgi:hypothetical protein